MHKLIAIGLGAVLGFVLILYTYAQSYQIPGHNQSIASMLQVSQDKATMHYPWPQEQSIVPYFNRMLMNNTEFWERIAFQVRYAFMSFELTTKTVRLPQTMESSFFDDFGVVQKDKPYRMVYQRQYREFWEEDGYVSHSAFWQTLSGYAQKPKKAQVTINDNQTASFSGFALKGFTMPMMENKSLLLRSYEQEVPAFFGYHVETHPKIHLQGADIQDFGLLATGISDYSYSSYKRIRNVHVGLSKTKGQVVPAGRYFSAVQSLGPVTAAAGYEKETVIKAGGNNVDEYGGGLCQVSTTHYRAAMLAGLSIPMRTNHSYMVSHYTPPGTDATIYMPRPDFRFLNDTGAPIVIQTHYNDDTELAYVNVYGKQFNRLVDLYGPVTWGYVQPGEAIEVQTDDLDPGVRQLKDPSHVGFKAKWERRVRYPNEDKNPMQEEILSQYRAVPAKVLVGADSKEIKSQKKERQSGSLAL